MSDKKITFREAITEALEEELARNPNTIILGEDVLTTNKELAAGDLAKKFPGQVINHLPLVEEMLCGIGLGMTLGGLKPIIQLDHGNFLTLAFYEIFKLGTWRYRMAEENGPGVVIRVGHSGYLPSGLEFNTSLFSTILSLPNIWIAAPAFAYHAKGLLKSAIRANQPVLFIEHKKHEIYERPGPVPKKDYTLPFPASVVCKSGQDITIVSWQLLTFLAIEAAEELKNDGIEAEVISLQTLYPLDIETIIASAKKTGRLIIAAEEMRKGGIGAEISAEIVEALPGCRIKRVTSKNVPVPYSLQYSKLILPGKDDITNACRELLQAN